jgi:hypothetical protein
MLELKQWTNRNQEFSLWTIRKQWGLQRNLIDFTPLNFISLICFHLTRVGNG